MKHIGIDYGEKRVGVAVSDVDGRMAFPKAVFPNDRTLMTHIKELIANQNTEVVVIGESTSNEGTPNPVMAGARAFAQNLARETGLPVHFEPEFYSSAEARLLKEQGSSKVVVSVDAEAAAVILNSYLMRAQKDQGIIKHNDH